MPTHDDRIPGLHVPALRMHEDEIATDAHLVRRLLAARFPDWANLPIVPVHSSGTDNAMYRLGDDMAVRLPRAEWAQGQIDKEQRWLPILAPRLPLAIPVPLAKGEPTDEYPCSWSIQRWLPGENAIVAHIADPRRAAADLAGFVAALHGIDSPAAPPPGRSDSSRGVPLARRDAATREAIASLDGVVDTTAAAAAWEAALGEPPWSAAPVWIHGDLTPGNLLVDSGRLTAVLDFATLAVGDPACDLAVAWSFLSAETRPVFRAVLGVDEATWARGRGWALSLALIVLPYYMHTNPVMVAGAHRTIAEVLADA